jgi:hypothetical protein
MTIENNSEEEPGERSAARKAKGKAARA